MIYECKMQNAKCRIAPLSARVAQPFCILHFAFCISSLLHKRNLINLAKGGRPLHHLQQCRLSQEVHPFVFRGLLDLRGGAAVDDHAANTIREIEKFRDGGAAVESGTVAVDAAGALPERLAAIVVRVESRLDDERIRVADLVLALGADAAHQALGQHAVERGDEVVEVDLHVEEAAEDVDDVVRVHGGEDQVAGQRRLHRDRRRLLVADLADHDLVGVVAEDGPEAAREGEALLLVDGDLGDAAELVLDRILDGDDLVLGALDLRQRGVERGGLARAGRPGDQHHTVRLLDELAELQQHLVVEAEDVEPQVLELGVHRLLVENTDDRVLAVRGGDDADAEVDGAAGDAQLEAAVLGLALLGDVELGHDHDAADDRGVVALVDRVEGLVEHAVDAVLDDDLVVARLDVDVRGPALDSVEDDGVDQLDDRRRLLLGDRVDRQRLFALVVLADELHAEALGGLIEHALRRLRLLELVADGRRRGHLDPQRRAEEELELVELQHVRRVAHHDGDVPVLPFLRQELVADHQIERHGAEELVIDLEMLEVDVREAVLLGHPARARGLPQWVDLVERARISGHGDQLCPTLLSWKSGK